MPPFAEEAEKAVIGALLLESTAIHEVYNLLDQNFFYNESLGEIYGAIKAVWDEKSLKPDMVNVTEELKKRGSLEAVGGPYAIASLTMSVASTANIREHAEYIHQNYLRRLLRDEAIKVLQEAVDLTTDVSDAIGNALRGIEELASKMEYSGGATHLSEAVKNALRAYTDREALKKQGKTLGISTGLRALDVNLCGFQPKQLIIIGARPAMGKTALALHMAKHAALGGVPAVFFTLEMDAVKLADRIILSMNEVQPIPYRGGYLTDAEKTMLNHSASIAEQLPIYVDDSPSLNIRQIKARCVNLKRKGKCGIVFIDYLGLLNMAADNSYYGREQEVAQTSRAAKMMAKELDVPVVLLSQLNRGIEGKIASSKQDVSDLCPSLADLRESGAIEQDADVVLMLHRPEYYDKTKEKGVGIVNIAKQREGKTGKVKICYNESLTSFFDIDEVQMEGKNSPF